MTIGWEHDEASFRAALDELAGLLAAPETLGSALGRVVDLACSAIGGCDLASVTWLDGEEPETIVCTNPLAEEIDRVQYANDSGPCLYAVRRREVVSVPSMAAGDSWLPVRERAISRGVRSSLSLPLVAGDVKLGALNLYSHDEDAFSALPTEAALLFATHATAAALSARAHDRTREVVKNLENALETRDVIGMAKGVIMSNEKVTPDEAFAILRDASQHRNVKVRDLAAEVVATGVTPRR